MVATIHPLVQQFIDKTAEHVSLGRTVRIRLARHYSNVKGDVSKFLKGDGKNLWLKMGRKWNCIAVVHTGDAETPDRLYRMFEVDVLA